MMMYILGENDYDYHCKTYVHHSRFGFMEIDNSGSREVASQRLIGLTKRAGANCFFAIGAHHDNFDMYDSAHHDWNSVKAGPR